MGHSQKKPDRVSVEDYLPLDERSTTKLEYLDGVVYEGQGGSPSGMAGARKEHNLVTLDVCRTFREHMLGRACSIFVVDVKLAASNESAFFFPDVMVTFSEKDHESRLVVKEPSVVVEVLSPSTELVQPTCSQASSRAAV